MAVVAKKDIENLTKQVLNQKRDILEAIEQEHVQIDSSLLHEKFFPEFTQKSNKIIEPQLELINGEPQISLNDMEALICRFDELDKVLSTPKILSANNNMASSVVRKENHGIKRFGSMSDLNKTLMRSSSVLNLNSTKIFADPRAPAPRVIKHSEFSADVPKLTSIQLAEHNALKQKVEACLQSLQHEENSYTCLLYEITNKYRNSHDRLKHFFGEIQRVQSDKAVKPMNEMTLGGLDEDLLNLMKNLAEILTQVRFIAENQKLYDSNGIKTTDYRLSDNLTDILEHFYKNNRIAEIKK